MPRPRVYKTEAIVLAHSDFGEADRLCTLYTPSYGKLRAIAKGVRRPLSRKAGHLEPLTRTAFLLAQGRTLDVVAECNTIDAYMPVRDDLWRTACAMYLAELVDQFTAERAENYPVYRLLVSSLEGLSQGQRSDLLLRFFEVNLLQHLGFRPELGHCAGCGAPVTAAPYAFSPSAGGLVCAACRQSRRIGTVRPLSADALRALRVLQRGDFRAAAQLELWDELAAELEMLLRQHLWYLLERELKSVAILDQLRRRAGDLRPAAGSGG